MNARDDFLSAVTRSRFEAVIDELAAAGAITPERRAAILDHWTDADASHWAEMALDVVQALVVVAPASGEIEEAFAGWLDLRARLVEARDRLR